MNVNEMRAIGQAILLEPCMFNMEYLYTWADKLIADGKHSEIYRPPCGTVACFAGHWADLSHFSRNPLFTLEDCEYTLDLPIELEAGLADLDPWSREYAEYFVQSYIATNGWTSSGSEF